ncbi:hypothetical protein [Phytohabitans aurantiacus]|uniref:DUF732 domain-containing protein n=1 Tax=Phytohabitans aurantiacus TaxID=3016789 RepID=A0ABQ5QUL4_9ACTN|nr:hypothetical protein [Phytohabitans aurantiacus]GLH97341.1 hypothetical protein Pa4123_26160 [Phytohabitans aurantiacus]
MRARHAWVAAAAAVFALGCGAGGAGEDKADEPPATTAPAVDMSAALAAAGIPPAPEAKAWTAYIAALRKIDPAIVGDDEEKAVDRGRNQCGSVKEHPDDEAKLVDLTNKRFTAPGHSAGFGKAKATKILAAVRKYICPSY